MWIRRKDWEKLNKRVADLEEGLLSQQRWIKLLNEFCRSVANKEGLSFFSYQQLHAPTADSREKVRVLFKEIRKFG